MEQHKVDAVLANLVSIETGLAQIYQYLANREHFSRPVRMFWNNMQKEEQKHAQLIQELRNLQHSRPDAVEVTGIDRESVQAFIDKIKTVLIEVKKPGLSESAAYSIGAVIEAELDEGAFIDKIKVADAQYKAIIRSVANDCKKHSAMLAAYAHGAR